MPVGNEILKWIIIIALAYFYGVIVQRVLKYDRSSHLVTLSIGAIGILLGRYLLPFLNLTKYLYIDKIPLLSSLIGSFILPGILWLLRQDYRHMGNQRNGSKNR